MKTYSRFLTLIFFSLLSLLTGCDNEEDALVTTPTNQLVAVAGEDRTTLINQEVVLDGSASYDKADKPFTYYWKIKTRPAGSAATLNAQTDPETNFTPDKAGIYIIELSIRQDKWTSKDEVFVTATAPGSQEPLPVVISEDINSATTLTDIFEDPDQPDYLITNDINVYADLTIAPGAVLAFSADKGLHMIQGIFSAKGTAALPIVFRGIEDVNAYWKGIEIFTNSLQNEIEYTTIKGAGSSAFTETGVKANLALSGSTTSASAMKLSHTALTNGGGYGLYVKGLSTLIGYEANTIANNALAAAYIPARQLHQISAQGFSGANGFDGVETGGSTDEGEVTWKKLQNASYLVTSEMTIKGGVTIEPGTTVKVRNGLTIKVLNPGFLNATGTENERITFTSSAAGVYWNGIYMNSSALEKNNLIYTEISSAGQNKMGDALHPANVALGWEGLMIMKNSIIRKGKGYGMVAKVDHQVNTDIVASNQFSELQTGWVWPTILNYPDKPALKGMWLDQWSFVEGRDGMFENYYNRSTGVWFNGAAKPWAIETEKGFGLQINEDGTFEWTVAEQGPVTGCPNFSAEYMTGTATYSTDHVTFEQKYWRSKFVNECDATQNVDTDVETSQIMLKYEINKMYNLFTGASYWQLKFINPDNSSFSFYRN